MLFLALLMRLSDYGTRYHDSLNIVIVECRVIILCKYVWNACKFDKKFAEMKFMFNFGNRYIQQTNYCDCIHNCECLPSR